MSFVEKTAMRIVSESFIVQQQTAVDEMQRLTAELLASGKCLLKVPPDCFIWTGTKEELEAALNKHAIKLNEH